ncbi:MAG: acyl-CoA dehydrogenase [Sphingomonadales bacterium]|nr:MAG: acyl-CoA dehydrogenase [Sphingomonadales bacterium]
MRFEAPVADIGFCLEQIAGLGDLRRDGLAPEADSDFVCQVLDRAGRMAESLIAPLDLDADRIGSQFEAGRVTTPPGFVDAYARWCSDGWVSADAPVENGGMGLPMSVGAALTELWHSGSMGFAMGLLLTQAASELLSRKGSEELKAIYLPRLVSGEWAATMSMTEPQAGSDLTLSRALARAQPDGSFRITANKIFISYGEHDLTSNIVHMVLARIDGAGSGERGLSLFLVPKRIPDAHGNLGEMNDVVCTGIERKLGLHGSPTCMMAYGAHDGAVGWLVGEEGQGLPAMFTMMNRARLGTGLQGAGVGEKATQLAFAYARSRIQGRGPAGKPALIIEHPDVQRMLLDMRSGVMAVRGLSYFTAIAIDRAAREPDPKRRRAAADRAALLTPIVKAWGSDIGVDVASLGIQVHGGAGFVEETGAAQRLRDIRIAPIYEGTNGLQAIDLVLRKLVRGGRTTADLLLAELRGVVAQAEGGALASVGALALEAIDALEAAIDWIVDQARTSIELHWAATPALRLFGDVVGGVLLLKGALAEPGAHCRKPEDMVLLARFFAEKRFSHAPGLLAQVRAGAGVPSAAAGLAAYT